MHQKLLQSISVINCKTVIRLQNMMQSYIYWGN